MKPHLSAKSDSPLFRDTFERASIFRDVSRTARIRVKTLREETRKPTNESEDLTEVTPPDPRIEKTLTFRKERFKTRSTANSPRKNVDKLFADKRSIRAPREPFFFPSNGFTAEKKSLYAPQVSLELGCAAKRIPTEHWDTGLGIAVDIHEKIFEPIHTRPAARLGTGLALSISCGILESHQWNLFARTPTRFTPDSVF